MEEVKKWFDKAKDDLKKAKDNSGIGNYDVASFLSQQGAEKALKALLLGRGHGLIKTHDLVLLARILNNIPDNILQLCKDLTPVYIETRYPIEEGFKEFIENFEKVQFQNSLRRTLPKFPSEIALMQSSL